ncbi:hypothetical protein INT45_005155 [Circinella minor]|uniref:RING-type domain-containing protein n=1 Tax=Circinella minor TaxID=1195481 RepID=A0A8H7RS29_9FUNG|nr:hypothetical protein INT45_005155 [Circinella minor]
MDYYCHSCQEETQIIAAHYLACERCLSDFVEEIEPIQDNRTTWSDEDETLASLWNSVFRNGFSDTPLPGTYPQQQQEVEYGNDDLTNILFPNNNEPTDTTFPNDNNNDGEEETGYDYPYNEYYQHYDENDEREEEEEEEYNPDYFFFDNYREHVNDNEEPNSPWPTDPNSDDDYQDLVSNNSNSNNRSSLNENEEGSVDYLSIQDEIGNEYVEWRSISSDDNNYEEFESDPTLFHRYSYDNNSYEEETVTAEEEEDSDIVGLGELLRETLTVDNDVNIYPDVEDNFTNDVDEYDPPPEYYESEFDSTEYDPDYHLSTLLRIIQEQHETTFTDPSNWEYDLSRHVQSASEELIASLPRHQLNRGDTATYSDCSICLNSLGFNIELINLPCMHGFHSGCIEQWLQVNASCPVCRSPACTSS